MTGLPAITTALLVVTAATASFGCGSGSAQRSSGRAVPKPPLARVLPPSYRAQRVWRASLTGGSVPDVIVSSVGPLTGSFGFHPADLQVLSWDTLAHRWSVLFDAEKVIGPDSFVTPQTSNSSPEPFSAATGSSPETTPLLDPKANVSVGQVRFAHLLLGHGEQMIFSETASYGGSGLPGELGVVDFKGGVANVVYLWSADGGARYRIVGKTILSKAEFWTAADPHRCPARSYSFTIGRRYGGYLTELSDQRPWLGVYARPLSSADPGSPVMVVGVVPGSPAATVLRQGDVLLSLKNPPKLRHTANGLLGPAIIEQLETLNAGHTAELLVSRNGTPLALSVKLGSLADRSVGNAGPRTTTP